MTDSTENHSLSLIKISGEGSKKLLQGQLTCNLDELAPMQLSAHCNPQGRIISLFYLIPHHENYYLLLPSSMNAIATNALKKYAVFFKVSLTDASNELHAITKISESDITPWKTNNIAAGIPMIYPETSEKLLPHEINLQLLNAISFDKGCYTGQEIIARMQYRGKLKNHMYRVNFTSVTTPNIGAEIYNQSNACGSIVDFVTTAQNHYEALVVAPITDANSASLFLDIDKTINLHLLAIPYSL